MDFRVFGRYVFGTLENKANIIYIELFSPLSPFHWPQNRWPWMTLNGLNGHFTSNFHYYELSLSNYLLLICCRVCLHLGLHLDLCIYLWVYPCDQRKSAGSGVATVIRGIGAYLESTEKLQIFRGRYIVGILTNKINIIIIVLLSALSPFHWLQNTWLWITLNRHIALNYVLRHYIWCSEAWLSKFLYS